MGSHLAALKKPQAMAHPGGNRLLNRVLKDGAFNGRNPPLCLIRYETRHKTKVLSAMFVRLNIYIYIYIFVPICSKHLES